MFVEWAVSSRLKLQNFSKWEVFTSLAIIFIDRFFVYLSQGNSQNFGTWFWDHRLLHSSLCRNWVVIFMVTEFAYYWSHRYNHSVNLGWASHSIHHAPTRYNLTMAARFGVTRIFSLAYVFFLPLLFIGFYPQDIALMVGIIFLYQFFLHTELVPKLGVLEKFLNTPSNHRVHHSSDPNFYGKNLGGITLIFDRLFGTHRPEPQGGVIYGMPSLFKRKSLFNEIFNYWILMFSALKKARGLGEYLRVIFGPAGSLSRSTRSYGNRIS